LLLVRVMPGNSDEGHQLRAVDRLAFEQQFDDLIECGAMFREQCGRFCRTSPKPPPISITLARQRPDGRSSPRLFGRSVEAN
jgi:hypothetical protein